ncbi:MAG TPA: hypothetical protein DCL44_12600 [Elusimicrobia bacterium]|nr:hypothetical protein [Elusimicrobiota bacterium]
MYTSFEDLSVKDDIELRDEARLRRLYSKNFYGIKIAAACCLVIGAALAALTLWLVSYYLTSKNMPARDFWTLFGVGAGFGIMCLGMGLAFLKEISRMVALLNGIRSWDSPGLLGPSPLR